MGFSFIHEQLEGFWINVDVLLAWKLKPLNTDA
jgi:hypothetical protein